MGISVVVVTGKLVVVVATVWVTTVVGKAVVAENIGHIREKLL